MSTVPAFHFDATDMALILLEQCKYLSLYEEGCRATRPDHMKDLLGFFGGWGHERARVAIQCIFHSTRFVPEIFLKIFERVLGTFPVYPGAT